MEGSYPDWTTLPVEIFSKILLFTRIDGHRPDPYNVHCVPFQVFARRDGHLPDPNNAQRVSFQVALVCKAWRNLAQSFLFSKVNISISQLEKFHDVIISNTSFGTMVKELNLYGNCFTNSDRDALLTIVPELLSNRLPNLEYFHLDRYPRYFPTLNALLDSKLKYLNRIQIPTSKTNSEGLVQYISCAFLMRERLQEVYVSNDFSSPSNRNTKELAIIKFQQLYDNLSQFSSLKKILMRQTGDGVQILEHVIETCRSLRDVNVTLSSLNNQKDCAQLKDNIDFDTTSHYIPKYNIKMLTIWFCMTPIDNCKVLLYIMKKLPNLEELNLHGGSLYSFREVQVTPYIIIQLLNYLVKIKTFHVSYFTMNQGDIYQIMGNFWNTTSKQRVKTITLRYYNHHDEAKSTFYVRKNSVTGISISLDCSLQLFYRQRIDFIERIGRFLVNLAFVFDGITSECNTSEFFLFHALMYCPNLRNLHVENFEIHECKKLKFDKINQYSLDKLTLKNCVIDSGILEQLSTILSEVNQLRLNDTTCCNNENISYINMPQTKIQSLTLGSSKVEPAYVKLFVVTDQKYYYYQPGTEIKAMTALETGTKLSEQIDEKVYGEVDGTEFYKFEVCFETKPEILFDYYKVYKLY